MSTDVRNVFVSAFNSNVPSTDRRQRLNVAKVAVKAGVSQKLVAAVRDGADLNQTNSSGKFTFSSKDLVRLRSALQQIQKNQDDQTIGVYVNQINAYLHPDVRGTELNRRYNTSEGNLLNPKPTAGTPTAMLHGLQKGMLAPAARRAGVAYAQAGVALQAISAKGKAFLAKVRANLKTAVRAAVEKKRVAGIAMHLNREINQEQESFYRVLNSVPSDAQVGRSTVVSWLAQKFGSNVSARDWSAQRQVLLRDVQELGAKFGYQKAKLEEQHLTVAKTTNNIFANVVKRQAEEAAHAAKQLTSKVFADVVKRQTGQAARVVVQRNAPEVQTQNTTGQPGASAVREQVMAQTGANPSEKTKSIVTQSIS